MKRPDGWVKERLYDGAPNFIGFFDIDPFHISFTGVVDDVGRRLFVSVPGSVQVPSGKG
jgi:hypothetical protein